MNVSQYKSKKGITFAIYSFIFFFAVSLFLISVHAASNTWNFSSSSDYTFDNSSIIFSSGIAQLRNQNGWYDPNWLYRKQITIDNTKFSSDETNFPLLINLSSDTDLSSKALSNGNDILFTTSDGVTKINHEVEQYTSSTGALAAWINVPSISSSSATTLYMYYGNSSASPQENVNATWDSNDVAVWHMNDASTAADDSTSNANNATQANGVVFGATGKIGPAISLDGSNDKLSATSNTSLNVTGPLTISAWVNPTLSGKLRIVAKTVTSGTTDNPYDFGIGADNKLYFNRANASTVSFMSGDTTIPTNTWTQVGVVVGGDKSAFTNVQKLVTVPTDRAWQGVASDGTDLYVVTDETGSGFGNIISKYDMTGTFIKEQTNAYNPDPNQFYSFGNGTVINGKLYVGAYNANSLGASGNINYTPLSNLKSRIAVFSLTDLSLLEDHDLGTQVKIAEGIDYHDGYFWVIDGWFDTFSVLKYDTNFNLIATYPLPVVNPVPSSLTYQNINWKGNDIFVNWHGSNTNGSIYAYGLDRYTFDGTNFTFDERVTPVAYGAGQGIAIVGDTFYWADRPGNAIWKSTYVGPGNGDLDPASVDFVVNGVKTAANERDLSFSTATTNTSSTLIGTRGDSTNFYGGKLDELRISDVARSPDWLSAQYSNENSPSTFYSLDPEVNATNIPGTPSYSTSDPTISPVSSNAVTFTSLSGFSETATKNGGEIKYQISNDAGTTWYWYNSGWTTTTSGYSEANTASDINTNISSFPVGSGQFLFKAYLHSDGSQLVQLDGVNLTYSGPSPTPTATPTPTPTPAPIIIDNVTGTGTGFSQTGTWTSSTGAPGYYGTNYQFDDGTGSGNSTATWTPTITSAGTYDVSINYITNANRATNVPLKITDNTGTHSATVNEQTGGNGIFFDLGNFTFDAGTSGFVKMSNAGANGFVIADAVKFTFIAAAPTPTSTPTSVPTATPTPTPTLTPTLTPTPTSAPSSTPTPTPSQTVSSDTSSNTSSNSNSISCTASSPGSKAPSLYGAIANDSSSIEIYFTDADGPVDHYTLEYGTELGTYPYGIPSFTTLGQGMQSYSVNALSPNTTYYFRVRGDNACAVGSWSNELSSKTKSIDSLNPIISTHLTSHDSSEENISTTPTVSPSPTPDQTTQKTIKTYSVNIAVKDTHNNPVSGATVTIHSKPQTAITDANGVAHFENVESGDHTVLIAYGNVKGQQTLSLNGDVKEYNLNVTVQPKNPLVVPSVDILVGVLVFVIVVLAILLFKRKKQSTS